MDRWEEDHRGKVLSHHIRMRLTTVDVGLGHLAEVVFGRFLPWKATPLSVKVSRRDHLHYLEFSAKREGGIQGSKLLRMSRE